MTPAAVPPAGTGSSPVTTRIGVESYPWPEVTRGADLTALVAAAVELVDGDVLVLTSKVVSKSLGLVVDADRSALIAREAVRVVARRGPTVIAETRHGLVMAAAGVDASNVPAGSAVALPPDSDESARRLRRGLYELTGRNVAVVVTDTAGRAWRNGQTDMAVGCAGMAAIVDLTGTADTHANVLQVTAPAVADELAGAADLVKGKATGRPLAVVRGLSQAVLPAGEDGAGARSLVRPPDDDLFGLGARDAVVAAATRRDPVALAHFPRRLATDPDPFADVTSSHPEVRLQVGTGGERPGWVVQVSVRGGGDLQAWLEAGRLLERIDALAAAHRLTGEPLPDVSADNGWPTVSRTRWFVA
jgi:coenzyme F420-0:L-glutamate ligase/coenzyme F420-1:gamma-L-glutamate ligase